MRTLGFLIFERCSQIDAPLSFDEHPEFDKNIGDEIYSWLSLWADELVGKN